MAVIGKKPFQWRVYCHVIVCFCFCGCNLFRTASTQVRGATVSSVWTHPEETNKPHPLHWLQQHLPHLFGNSRLGSLQNKNHNKPNWAGQSSTTTATSSSSHSKSPMMDHSRRRHLYEDAWQRHIPEHWADAETKNVTSTAWTLFSHRSSNTFPPFPPSMRQATLEKIRHMFYHSYNGYYYHAWPHGELLPGTCQGTNFSLIKLPALTAIDALDSFWVLGNTTEMVRIVERLRKLEESLDTATASSLWDVDQNISLFETTIRILGGLLSAHQILQDQVHVWTHDVWDVTGEVIDGRSHVQPLPADQSHRNRHHDPEASCPAPPPPMLREETWSTCPTGTTTPSSTAQGACGAINTTQRTTITAVPYAYDGYLLRLAIDIADRMIPAFDTETGIPYGTVNLRTGVPIGETPVASLAGAGTLVLEWELLSRLTGRSIYGQVARRAARGLWMRQSSLHLVGKHIDSSNGQWVESLSGIGSNSDSFIEYLVKYCFIFLDGRGPDDDFRSLWPAIYQGIFRHLRRGDWYADTDFQTPATGRLVLESLMAFYPGLQVWLGELAPAARSLNAFFLVREHLGFLPERFNYNHWNADGPKYPLRPELFESNYFMHKAIQNVAVTSPFSNRSAHSGWLWAAAWSVDKLTRLQTSCGFASLNRVDPERTGALGQSSADWKGDNDMPSFFLSETLKYLYLTFDEDNPIHTDIDRQWMFSTEAHPIYLPPDNHSETFAVDLARLEEILLHRVEGSKAQRQSERMEADLWAEETNLEKFLSVLWPIELEMKREQISRPRDAFFFMDRRLVEPTVHASSLQRDDWGEIENLGNLAHMKFVDLGIGSGFSLRSACPNYYASDLLWIHVLHGEMFDFTDGFMSTKDDRTRAAISNIWPAYGSVEAVGLVGTAYNPRNLGQAGGCRLSGLVSGEKGKKKKIKEKIVNGDTTEFESDLGTFQVKAFPEGEGFSVHRVDEGDLLTASFLHTLNENDQSVGVSYVMLSSENPQVPQLPKNVRMSDFSGNSFSCDVSLSMIPNGGDFPDEFGIEVVRVPCTPGMFGPAHMVNLVQSKGVKLQALIHAPVVSDLNGCEAKSGPEHDNALDLPTSTEYGKLTQARNRYIQIVSRGDCSFMTKAMNQKRGRRADGVIIINTQDELFTMAGDPEFNALDPDESPLSVMVSKRDGLKLLDAMKKNKNLVGQISLELQPSPTALESLVNDGLPVNLPLIHASESVVQIYAQGYWGVQAVAMNENWSLQLVRHQLG